MLRVIITDECIREGTPDEQNNPLARALNLQQPVLRAKWRTTMKYAWLQAGPSCSPPIELPPNARKFLRLFKKGHRVFRPIRLEIEADRAQLARQMKVSA